MDTDALPQAEEPTKQLPETKPKQARKPKAPETLTRESGRSLLPHARVQRILKADKELIMVQREASFLISRATEEFIQRISEAAQRVAERERRTTVQGKDLGELHYRDIFCEWPQCCRSLCGPPSGGVRFLGRCVALLFAGNSTNADLAIELLPYLEPEPAAPGRRKPRAEQEGGSKGKGKNTLLDQFVKRTDESQEDEGPAMNIVMNEDGTMSMAPADVP
ncbi:hypothetical protein C8Q80DRAFT_396365 [Daedaleopsis nitida]|nr:hypothetical protein C8Q80DRAFT_396365 [Daedaleopsis nitida]